VCARTPKANGRCASRRSGQARASVIAPSDGLARTPVLALLQSAALRIGRSAKTTPSCATMARPISEILGPISRHSI